MKKNETISENINDIMAVKIEENDEDNDQVSEFFNFFSTAPRLRIYDKSFELHYDVGG